MTEQDPTAAGGAAGPQPQPDMSPTEPVPVAPPPAAPPPVAAPPPAAAEPSGWAQTPPPAAAPPPPAAPSQWAEPAAVQELGPAPGYAYAGFWRRFVAYLIDGFLFAIVFSIVFGVVFGAFDDTNWRELTQLDPVTGRLVASDSEIVAAVGRWLGIAFGALALNWLIHALYHIILWSWLGGTIGQLALGMQVRRESDGTKIGLGTSFLRYIGYLISIWVFYLGLIWVAFDRRKQGWHDKIASTLVVRRAG